MFSSRPASCTYCIEIEPLSDPSESSSAQENEEQLEQRLLQLLNLPIHHMTPIHSTDAHPALPSEADSLQENDSSFLSLDCAGLADSLSSLPLYQRLGLDLDLVELCEAEGNIDESVETVTNILDNIDLRVCAKKKAYTFEFEAKGLSLLKPLPNAGVFDITNPVSSQKQDASQEVEYVASPSSTLKQEACLQEDKKLDRLLENSLSLQQRALKESGIVRSTEVQQSSRVSVSQDNSSQPANNAELDDMLDDLLS